MQNLGIGWRHPDDYIELQQCTSDNLIVFDVNEEAEEDIDWGALEAENPDDENAFDTEKLPMMLEELGD